MPSFDRITGDYHLEAVSGLCGPGDLHFTANSGSGTVYVNGNLVVTADYSSYQTVNSITIDRFLTLGKNTPAGVVNLNGGIKLERGAGLPTVELRWSESVGRWQLTNDGVNFANIYGKEPVLSTVSEDRLPSLGGHLNTACYEIRSPDPCNIILNPGWDGTNARTAVQINHVTTGTTVPFIANAAVVYAKPASSGRSGLFITDNLARSEELITKRRAVVFSLVL